MGEFTNLMIVVFTINVVLLLFFGMDIPGSALFTFLTNPEQWDTIPFSALISDLTLTLGGIAVVAGTFLIKSDLLIFAGIAGILYSFGRPLASLYSAVSANISPEIAMLVVGPIILLYAMTLLSWWRGRD